MFLGKNPNKYHIIVILIGFHMQKWSFPLTVNRIVIIFSVKHDRSGGTMYAGIDEAKQHHGWLPMCTRQVAVSMVLNNGRNIFL